MKRSLSLVATACMLGASLPALAGGFTLTSPVMKAGGPFAVAHVLDGYGCKGGNISPALNWTGAPAGTQSYALTVYDPDAPTGSGWWHWVVVNIPASATGLAEGIGGKGQLPSGALETRTDFGKPGYGGACPPPGKPHRYIFKLYALKTGKLDVGADASGAMVGYFLKQAALAEASLTVLYGR